MQINKNGWVQLPKKLLDDMDWHENDNLLFRQEKEGVFLHKEEKNAGNALFVRCFEHFHIEYAGEEIPVKNKKLREMLAYLITYNNELINKWTVAQQLWPDSSKTQAMDCLYKVLRCFVKSENLIEKIPLEIYREQLRIRLSVREIDFLLFEQFALSKDTSLWLEALKLYQGGFLETECYKWSIQQQMKYEIKFEILQEKLKEI